MVVEGLRGELVGPGLGSEAELKQGVGGQRRCSGDRLGKWPLGSGSGSSHLLGSEEKSPSFHGAVLRALFRQVCTIGPERRGDRED